MRKRRHPDGRFCGSREPVTPSPRIQLSRWVEAEVLRRKTLGVTSFAQIAEQITKVGRSETPPVVDFPPGFSFPPNYSISAVACWKACQRALDRSPRLGAEEMRLIDSTAWKMQFLPHRRELSRATRAHYKHSLG